jgi:hypothetical protein
VKKEYPMRINPILYGILVVTVFLGAILGFQAAGIWSVSGKVDASGERVAPSAADVNSIKGWMTLAQVAATFGVTPTAIITQFKLPADTAPETAIKDLESDTFSVTSLRAWLGEQNPGAIPAPTVTP